MSGESLWENFFQPMDSRLRGEELSQLARFLFDDCADKWYAAFGLEVFAGILALILDLLNLPSLWALGGALLGLALLILAYYLRLLFEDQYHSAETMRRQSVLTEALDEASRGFSQDTLYLPQSKRYWRYFFNARMLRRNTCTNKIRM
jgi:hypothetical protein